MFRNYFIIALRTLLKQKLYSFINIGGLAVGLTCFILIMLFVQHEFSYDKFYENTAHIYRIVQRYPGYDYLGTDRFAPTSAPLASTLAEEYPEVTSATTVRIQPMLLHLNEQSFWEKALWADPHFFDVFNMPLLRGNRETALSKPNSLILTASLAHKIFGDQDPVGQTLMDQNQSLFTVTGLIPDLPANSSLRFTFITTIQSLPDYGKDLTQNQWDSNNWYTFFTLADGSKKDQLQAKMPSLVEKYVAPKGGIYVHVQYLIQSLNDVHLHSNFNHDIAHTGDIKYVYLFTAIACVILLLACVNYTNLAAARSIKRAREVGMRKAIGARRGQLIIQFLGESVLMACLALVLALLLVQLLLPFFGHLVERPIQMDYLDNRWLLPGLLMLVVLVGLLSGSYPAFFMASLRPIQVLKGKVEGSTGRFSMQRLLIVGQYAVSIVLVAGSFVIYQQLQYVQHKELGYDRENVVTVRVTDETLRRNYATIREVWLRNPSISAVTASGDLPTNVESATSISKWEGSRAQDQLDIYRASVDYDFLEVFGIELIAGRNFSQEFTTDSASAVLINETAARALGWTPQEAIGKHFMRKEGEKTIIGVVKDFHMHSLHLSIQPLMIFIDTEGMRYISVRLQPQDLPKTMAFLEKSIKQFSSYPFEYQFLDEHFDQLYKADLRLGETFGCFTILALLIASLGLFGLAAFTAEQRTKEVGIRKVMGASVRSIVALLTKDFLSMVAVAFLLATPVAWYVMYQWLQDFAYRIHLQWWMFALPGILALLIAWLTVSFQSIKAAITNPVNSLRNE